MPRTSAEERSASFYRAAKQPLQCPRSLSPRARQIWADVVESKPPDWFDGGCVGILADHCRVQARIELIWQALDGLPVKSKESAALTNQLKVLQGSFLNTSRQLRLGVQSVVDVRSAKNGESKTTAPDILLGGLAVHRATIGEAARH